MIDATRVRIAAMVLVLAACGAPGESDSALERLPRLELGELRVLSVDSVVLHEVRDLAIADQDLWVINGSPPYFARFRLADGELLASGGTRGGGPAEWRAPLRLVASRDRGTWVYDPGRRAMRRLAADASIAEEVAVPIIRARELMNLTTFGESLFIAEFGDDLLVSRPPETGVTNSRHLWRIGFVRLPWTGGQASSHHLEPLALPIDPDSGLARVDAESRDASLFLPVPLWTTCGADELIVLDPTTGTLWTLGAGSHSWRSQNLVLPRGVRLTENRVLDIAFGMAAPRGWREAGLDSVEIRQGLRRALENDDWPFPEVTGGVARMVCDDRGRVWLQRVGFDSDPRGYGSEWLVLDRSGGEFVGIVELPPAATLHQIVRDSVWVIWRDELDRPWPAAIPLASR